MNKSGSILEISPRGQVTIPKQVRSAFTVNHFICYQNGQRIILEPLMTKDGFLEELEKAEEQWIKEGGLTVKQMKKKFKIK